MKKGVSCYEDLVNDEYKFFPDLGCERKWRLWDAS